MALIEREAAIALIEQKQKELCPVGKFSRHAVYGRDRDRFDAWDEIIDQIDGLPTINASPVAHGRWVKINDDTCWWYECFRCGRRPAHDLYGYDDLTGYCPHCGARMDGGEDDG